VGAIAGDRNKKRARPSFIQKPNQNQRDQHGEDKVNKSKAERVQIDMTRIGTLHCASEGVSTLECPPNDTQNGITTGSTFNGRGCWECS